QEAFEETGANVSLEVVMDGVEAVQYLRKEGKYTEKSLPDLILLDLNLPKWEGRDVLRNIKTDEHLRHIPIVILTTSNAAQDIFDAYHLYANCFINKPVDFESFFNVIEQIQAFWLQTATLPSNVS
ncbi:MAG: response regulator, partial [Lewinella sp.]|nr:response regulator [Lewinella sp.]